MRQNLVFGKNNGGKMNIFESYLTNQWVFRPSAILMNRAYSDYKRDSSPCKQLGQRNQCAIRMSIALGRCGFSIDAYSSPNSIHRDANVCRISIPHVNSAITLATYIKRIMGNPRTFRGQAKDEVAQTLAGQKGIIYFSKCYDRNNGTRGNHIDWWNGSQYFNQIIHISAGGSATASSNLFSNSEDFIWFFPL